MKYNILFLCDFNRNSANTIKDHILSFKKYSKHDIYFFNPVHKNKPDWFNLNKFDIIIIHYSIYILGDFFLNHTWREAITDTTAFKVQFIQDEYREVNAFHERMKELKIDLLFTCIPEEEIEKVYPSKKIPNMKKINNLTGYVSPYFEKTMPDYNMIRPIDVGYRGRTLGFWYGELAQEKANIGILFLEKAKNTGLKCDISSREEDRIYGKKWINFLKSCKCTLGTESGASVFDFTGDIKENVQKYCSKHPEANFKEVKDLFFKEVDGKIKLNQISPRVFEAIGCGCCLILYEGNYSGILKPDVHYIELKKDFSNIDEVFKKIKDDEFIRNMSRRAYEDIIASGKYSYQTFIKFFDKEIEKYFIERNESRLEVRPINNSSTNNISSKKPYSILKILQILNYLYLKTYKVLINFLYTTRTNFRRFGIFIKQLYLYSPFFFWEKIRLIILILKKN